MKTDAIIFKTTKSLPEISNDLRAAASKLRANMDLAPLAPFGYVGIRSADISVALSGPNFILGGPRSWGVQVLVTDNGDEKEVEMIAVGDNFSGKLAHGSFGQMFFELRDSIRRRNVISSMIR